MVTIREASIEDVEGIRDVFLSEYGDQYAYPQYLDASALARLVYAEASILLVAIDEASGRVAGTASVVFSVAAQNDLVGEFGRLVVHPDFRGLGYGKQLMQQRLQHVAGRLHVGVVENRSTHTRSQRISARHGFVPVGCIPMKLLVERRETIAHYAQHFGDALALRRNNPRIIPEAGELAQLVLGHCRLPGDAIIDDTSAAFPLDPDFETGVLRTEGYATLLRIERGRLRHRDVFGPVRLHYGLFQLQSRHSHYLLARRDGRVVGGIGYMLDEAEHTAKVIELITVDDQPVRFLLEAFIEACRDTHGSEYLEVDASAYAPRLQRTLLELGFLPVSYVPANVFHEVERLDVVRMARLLVPFDTGPLAFTEEMQPVADLVLGQFAESDLAPRLGGATAAPLFDGLNDEQRRRLAAIGELREVPAGQSFYESGEPAEHLLLLLDGPVSLRHPDGTEVARVGPGQCLGEAGMLGSKAPVHSLAAMAAAHVQLVQFPREDLRALIRRRPDIGVVLYRNLAVDLRRKLDCADRPGKD